MEVLPGDAAALDDVLRLPAPDDVERRLGELERQEEPQAVISRDASGRGHSSWCRLRVRTARTRCRAATVARALIVSRSPGSENSRPFSTPGAETWEWTSPTGFAALPPPGPATPVTAIPTSVPSRSRTPAAIAAATSADTAPCADEDVLGHPSSAIFTSFAYATMPPRTTSLDPGTSVSRAATIPPVQDSAVASVKPARAAELEHDLRDRPLVLAEEVALERVAQRRCELVAASVRSRLDHEVDVDLEVARADRRLHPISVAPRLREGLGDRGLAGAEEPEDAAARRARRREDGLHRRACDGRGPQPAELARRPREHDEHAAVRGDDEARSRPGDADHVGAVGDRRLLRHARCEVGVRPAESLGDRARHRLDLRLELAVDPERRAGDARDELDRPVVVRRAEPARDEADVRLAPGSERSLEVEGIVPDDDDPLGRQAERKGLTRVERAVSVVALPAHELAARDDDRRARSGHPAGANRRCPLRGMTIRWPFTFTATLPGRATERYSAFFVNRWSWPRSSVPV